MARNDLVIAINHLCAERGLDPKVVIEAIESALVSAYRRNFGGAQNVMAKIDTETGQMRVFAEMEVVEEVKDRKTQIGLEDARKYRPDAQVGDTVIIEATPRDFGRIAAQTAKQVIMQRIREAERETTYQELASMEGEVVQGLIQRVDRQSGQVVVNLGRGEGILPRNEQIPGERYRQNDRMYFYVLSVDKNNRGPQAILSRSHPHFVRRLMEREVPEIRTGAVEIRGIAREPGSRSKVAVVATQPGVDPVGSCVGMRGTRIQAVVNALGGERIDIIEWNSDPYKYIANALSPAKVTDVVLFEQGNGRNALVVVPDKQLSLAIGREGQNARLAARLTGWHIDIKSETEANEAGLDALERQRLRMVYARRKADLLARAEALLREGTLLPPEELGAEAEKSSPPEDEPEPEEEATTTETATPTASEEPIDPESADSTAEQADAGSEESTEDVYLDPEYLDQLALQQLTEGAWNDSEKEADSRRRKKEKNWEKNEEYSAGRRKRNRRSVWDF